MLNGFSEILDIALIAVLIYILLAWFKKTRAAFILTGMFIIGLVYLVASQFNLRMVGAVFEKFFAVFLIAVVVIFQEELRRFLERIAVWSFRRKTSRDALGISEEEISILVRTVTELAKEKIGALILIKGREIITPYLTGGTPLDGRLSESLLKSIFDPHSTAHDGAVVIEEGRISKFSAHLPLSKNLEKLGRGGTRHAAGLGIAELTDCLCIVVSEERGVVSVARNGTIQLVPSSSQLTQELRDFFEGIGPTKMKNRWLFLYQKNLKEKILAVGLALLLWFVIVHGAKITYRTLQIPVSLVNGAVVVDVQTEPKVVKATFRGPLRAFFLFSINQVRLHVPVDNEDLTEGAHRISVKPSYLVYPKEVKLESTEPKVIQFSIGNPTKNASK